jgi:hypothetical protein
VKRQKLRSWEVEKRRKRKWERKEEKAEISRLKGGG